MKYKEKNIILRRNLQYVDENESMIDKTIIESIRNSSRKGDEYAANITNCLVRDINNIQIAEEIIKCINENQELLEKLVVVSNLRYEQAETLVEKVKQEEEEARKKKADEAAAALAAIKKKQSEEDAVQIEKAKLAKQNIESVIKPLEKILEDNFEFAKKDKNKIRPETYTEIETLLLDGRYNIRRYKDQCNAMDNLTRKDADKIIKCTGEHEKLLEENVRKSNLILVEAQKQIIEFDRKTASEVASEEARKARIAAANEASDKIKEAISLITKTHSNIVLVISKSLIKEKDYIEVNKTFLKTESYNSFIQKNKIMYNLIEEIYECYRKFTQFNRDTTIDTINITKKEDANLVIKCITDKDKLLTSEFKEYERILQSAYTEIEKAKRSTITATSSASSSKEGFTKQNLQIVGNLKKQTGQTGYTKLGGSPKSSIAKQIKDDILTSEAVSNLPYKVSKIGGTVLLKSKTAVDILNRYGIDVKYNNSYNKDELLKMVQKECTDELPPGFVRLKGGIVAYDSKKINNKYKKEIKNLHKKINDIQNKLRD